jgi:hypothetical protein
VPTDSYRERLLPRWWTWLVVALLVTMLAVAYGAALGATVGWIVTAIGGALAVWFLVVTAPTVEVAEGNLVVDGARLPVTSIAEVAEVDAAEIARLRGPGADARLFVALRPWSAPNGVLVRLDDPADPHPAWLFTSRHPARVRQVIAATMTADGRATPSDHQHQQEDS